MPVLPGPDLLDDRDWQQQAAFLQLMMMSVAHLCHLFAPGMCERGFGRILNVSSVAGRIARAGDLNYGPSKTYVIALSEALDLTLRPQGVRVSALCPGYTHTPTSTPSPTCSIRKRQHPISCGTRPTRSCAKASPQSNAARASTVPGRLYRWVDPILQSVWTRPLARRAMGSR